ncbi:hypothetical protein [Klebsiella oxytoca]|uniref:hypothetical protein n=1 Tax=Klebsiella oxytoca TaxID=571 RepID=UPI0007CC8A2A|nr:hypothetical protein [Klebsiella oxytoca]SBM24580.1 Uncharacterised protein [Klebsiella oxytoca]
MTSISTITKEQLTEWVAQLDSDGGCDATDQQLETLIRQSLAATASEPVAWRCVSGTLAARRLVTVSKPVSDFWRKEGCEVRPLYAAPQPVPVLYLSDEHIDAVLDSRGNIEYVIADKRERLRMFAREILRAASSQPENQQTRALVMWIKRLSLALRSASPDNKLPKVAMGYLQNNGLISIADCLRGNNEEPPA